MKRRTTFLCRTAMVAAALGFVTACNDEDSEAVEVRSVHQGQYCSQETAGLYLIEPAELASLAEGQGGLADRWEKTESPTPPNVKSHERLILVSMGQKSSGGYALALATNRAELKGGIINLPIKAQQPAAGSMQTMQITSPCLIIALPASGYTAVKSDLFPRILPIK